ncbi:amidohydrolase [soil metagenome]
MPDLIIDNANLPLGEDVSSLWSIEITDGLISSVTTMADRESSSAPSLDAAGSSVLPAFGDSHIHVPESGVEILRCDMSDCISRSDVLETIGRYSAANPHREWIIGRGWALPYFTDVPATLEELDRVTGPRPAYLSNRDGHSAWVNSAALALAGVGEHTPDPAGGRIEHDADGKLTGLLHESAMQLVSDLIPPLSAHDLHAGLLAAQERLFSLGVTSWQDAIVGPFVPTTDVFDLYRSAEESGELRARVTGALWWPREYDGDTLATLIGLRDSLDPAGRFRASAIKIMYDGVCATLTASVSDPYLAEEGGTGLAFFERDALAPHVVQMDAAGFDLHFHVIGDQAVTDSLSLVRGAQQVNPARDRRHQLAHVWLVDDPAIAGMRELGVIANIQPFWAQRDSQMVDLTLPVLSERLRSLQFRFRTMVDAGIPLAVGSDWPVSSPNPMDGVHVAVNRAHPGDLGDGALDSTQALTLREALFAATAGSARALRRDDELGTIAVRKAADLVVLDENLTELDPAALSGVRPTQTLIDGDIVFHAN